MENYSLQRVQPYYEQIYQTLKELIFQGVYKSGERIYEAQIAKEFNVSRSPVREAVRALEKEGLLVLNEKSQLAVYKPSLSDVEDIYQCRRALESLAVEETVRNASDDEVKEIERLLNTTKKVLDLEDADKNEVIALNEKFHELVISFSRNSRLQKLLNDLVSLTHFYRVINFEGENRKNTIFSEHLQIFTHIQKRDAKAAAELMAQHMSNDLSHLKKLLETKGKSE